MTAHRYAALVLAALVGCSKSLPEATADSGAVPDLAPYPGATLLCSEHVTGAPGPGGTPGPHITWSAYATSGAQDRVAEHYASRLGRANHNREGDKDMWRFPKDKPARVLSLGPASANGP